MKYLALVFFIVAVTAQNSCPQSGMTQIATCYAQYFQNFNFISTPDFQTYIMARYGLLTKGVPAFKQICTWSNSRQQCIGSYDPACVTEAVFKSALGVSDSDAYAYLNVYGVDNWECGPGYNDVVANFYCLENVHLYHNDERLACNKAMNDSIVQQGFSCSILSTFVNCYSKVYGKYCGKIGGYLGCEFAKAGSVEDAPMCDGQLPTCSKNLGMRKMFGLKNRLAKKNF